MGAGLTWSAVSAPTWRTVMGFSDDEVLDESVSVRYGKMIKIEPNKFAVYTPSSITYLLRAHKNMLGSKLPQEDTILPDSDTLSDAGERKTKARIS